MPNNPYEGIQDFVAQVPEILQPLLVALLAMIPYFEGEGAAALGILVGVNPVVAAIAAASGNILIVIGVVLLGSRMRERSMAKRALKAAEVSSELPEEETPTRTSKGRQRLRRWMVRFGVPGASILAPIALPTHLTAAFFVASGVRKGWVILWQAIAIVLWTGLVAAAALGVTTALGW